MYMPRNVTSVDAQKILNGADLNAAGLKRPPGLFTGGNLRRIVYGRRSDCEDSKQWNSLEG